MSQCQLCLSYIKEIKSTNTLMAKMSKSHVDAIEEMHNKEKALQRHIDALKGLLASKGILLNEGENELYEIDQLANPPIFKKIGDTHQDANPNDHSDCFEREREIKDDYDYYARDDMNFDAERERRGKRLR